MGLFLIVCLLVLIISIIFGIIEREFSAFMGMLFLGAFIGVIIYLMGVCIGQVFASYKEETVSMYNIYGLEYKTESNEYADGLFVLGVGSYHSGTKINNKYYFFSISDYGKKLEELDGSSYNIYINETDEEIPNLKQIIRKQYYNSQITNWLFSSQLFPEEVMGYIITVPTNTIKIDYEVNI